MSQARKLLELLSDGLEHSTFEIAEKVYGSEHFGCARIGARVFDLKRHGFNIEGRKDELRQSLYWYKLIPAQNPPLKSQTVDHTPSTQDFFSHFDSNGMMVKGIDNNQSTVKIGI